MLRAKTFTDPRDHLQYAEAFLLSDRVFNMHQLRMLSRAAVEVAQGVPNSMTCWGVVVENDQGVVASAIETRRNALFVSPHSTEATQTLVDAIPVEKRVDDIVGRGDIAWRFAQALGQYQMFVDGTLYALTCAPTWSSHLADRDGVRFTVATDADHAVLTQWNLAFIDECGLNEPRAEVPTRVQTRIDAKQWNIASVAGVPVAMAGGTNVGHGIGSIGPVYTVPEARKWAKKLGQRVTAFACERLISQGATTIVLMADDLNPVSNAAYQKLGFVAQGKFLHLTRASNHVTRGKNA